MENQKYMSVLRERALSDCRSDWAFWVCNGRVIRNLYEMADAVENMNDSVFVYHVNDDNKKNDFAKWISEVLEDGELGHRLKRVRDRKQYAKLIRQRIRELENVQ